MGKLNHFFRAAFAVGLVVIFGGCSALETMDQMNKTTSDLNKKTGDMNNQLTHTSETTDHVSSKTDQVFDATLNMYIDLREGNSWVIRNDAWNAMDHWTQMPPKLAEAGAFFEAMEDQLWKDQFIDDEKNLEALEVSAVDQFIRKSYEYVNAMNSIPFHKSYDPSPFSHDNRMKNLYALAVTMHLINPNEEKLYADHHLKKVSMLDLFKSSLDSERDFNSKGKAAFPDYVNEVLSFKSVATYFIEIRANFLAAMAFGKIAKLDDQSDFVQDINGLKDFIFGWTADFRKTNLAELLMYDKWLAEAVKTCDWLIHYQNHCGIDGQLTQIIQKMWLAGPNKSSSTLQIQQAYNTVKTDWKNFLNRARQ